METRFSLTSKQIVLLLAAAALLCAGLSAGVFVLGMWAGTHQVQQLEGAAPVVGASSTPAPLGTLPRAMTATPRPKQPEDKVFSEADALKLAQEQAVNADLEYPLEVQAVSFTDGKAMLSGQITYMGYQGQVEISGAPYAADQRLRFQVTSATIAGQALPEDFFAGLEAEINQLFEQVFWGYDIQAVTVTPGQMALRVVRW